MTAISSSLFSIQTQIQSLNKSALNVANSALQNQTPQVDLAKEMTNQIVVEKAVALDVVSVQTADEMLGTLLDIKS